MIISFESRKAWQAYVDMHFANATPVDIGTCKALLNKEGDIVGLWSESYGYVKERRVVDREFSD